MTKKEYSISKKGKLPMEDNEFIGGGYCLKARCIQNSEIAHASPVTREVWDWLIKEANHKDSFDVKIKRGQCIRTYKDIQEGLSWKCGYRKMTYSNPKIENAMKYLRSRSMITTAKTTRGLIISIINFNRYQNPDNYKKTTTDTTMNTTLKPQTCHTINNNDNNDNNDNNINKSNICQKKSFFDRSVMIKDKDNEEIILVNEFDSARRIYPGTKRGLETEFEDFKKKHKDYKKVIDLLTNAIQYEIDWRIRAEKYNATKKDKEKIHIPSWKNFKTWLSQRCWEQVLIDILEEKKQERKYFE